MLMKHEAKLSALLASMLHTDCVIALFCVKYKQGNTLTILKNF